MTTRPLLAVDGDSLAHRAYHGLPKTMTSATGRPSGAIVGFTNFLLNAKIDQTTAELRPHQKFG